jgi:hypothetical protein
MSTWKRKLQRAHDRQQHSPPMQIAVYDPNRITSPNAAALAATRAAGCTCDPQITIEGIHATVAHDDWCALLRSRDVN